MRVLLKLIGSAAICLAASLTSASTQESGRPSIQVQPGNWGTASVQDIETVLTSVADVLLPYFPRHASVRIVVGFSNGGPRVLAEKSPDGAHRVLLNVQDTRWDQFAYQFSHEFCHILSNYDHREIGRGTAARSHQWFEETLCEVVSIVTLNRLASSWKESSPYAGWEHYAPAFREYAQRLLSNKHRQLPSAMTIAKWYDENERPLESDPYFRERNELVATSLLELFETTPGSLEAIGYLNLEAPSQKAFAAYLASWYACCPELHRPFVLRLMSLFARA
jgi:hypothetical protein